MTNYRPIPATKDDMKAFHSDDYIDFLSEITPANYVRYLREVQRFNIGDMGDCPIFEGLYDFCASSAGASLGAAAVLNQGATDVAINWSGGLHHAKKSQASGFCYVNDIVLAILELLKHHRCVLPLFCFFCTEK